MRAPQDLYREGSWRMRNVIRLGDATSHGGKVVSSSANHFKVHGVPVACVGDTCTCPIPGHTDCKITTGSPHHVVNGKRMAFEGDKVSCGATLIASSPHFKQIR
jgi:uncharacterized Zn-binding protein involved in type VI secretion